VELFSGVSRTLPAVLVLYGIAGRSKEHLRTFFFIGGSARSRLISSYFEFEMIRFCVVRRKLTIRLVNVVGMFIKPIPSKTNTKLG